MSLLKMKGYCFCPGSVEGYVFFCDEPYEGLNKIPHEGVLIIKYPYSTFIRLMNKAIGVISEGGTRWADCAEFLKKCDKPVIVGVGSLSGSLSNGDNIKIDIKRNGEGDIFLIG